MHRRMGPIFSRGGAEPSLPENFSSVPEKNCYMLTCKITLPNSPHPVIISKNPGFRTLYLARQNEFCYFRVINTNCFSLLAAGFCPKNNGFARVWGLARTAMVRCPCMET